MPKNVALASCITAPYYIGFGTAATHYGLTTQHRSVIWLVTPKHLRDRQIGEAQVRIVNPVARKFFGFSPTDVLGYKTNISDLNLPLLDALKTFALRSIQVAAQVDIIGSFALLFHM